MDEAARLIEEKMKKAIEALKKNFAGIRTGRASPNLLDHITVEYYGAMVPLKQIASIGVPEPRLLIVQAFDKNAVKDIEKAIQKSDLGLNPNTEGGVIRLNLPQPTQERRNELVKVVKKESEECKVSIRNIRKDGLTDIKKRADSEKWSEDRKKNDEAHIQTLTDKYIADTDKLLAEKEKEIMAV